MKILWISHNIPYPPKGGALQRNFNLIKEMAKYNRLFLIAFNQKALLQTNVDIENAVHHLSSYFEGIKIALLPSDKSASAKHSLVAKSLFTSKPYTVNWNKARQMGKLIEQITGEFVPDLIHYDTIGLAEYYNQQFKGPQILNHHNIESAMMMRRYKKENNIIKRLYFYQEGKKLKNYEKTHCMLFDANLVVSEDDGKILKDMIPAVKTEVVPNGVDVSYFSPTSLFKDKKSLVFAGGMGWYPNRDAMLYFAKEIWPLLKKKHSDVTITIIGRKPPEELIKLSKKDPNFIVKGFVDDVRPYLDKALIYVCPIRDGGGTRLKILDALSMAKPIVATAVAIEGLKVIPDKHILIGDTPEQFARQIFDLMENEGLRNKLSAEGRHLVENYYDWSIIGEKLNNIYIDCLKKKSKDTHYIP